MKIVHAPGPESQQNGQKRYQRAFTQTWFLALITCAETSLGNP